MSVDPAVELVAYVALAFFGTGLVLYSIEAIIRFFMDRR
jgi:hypothetical protein